MMNVYADNYPQEKIYVHFDKNMYNSGETIWFKAYIYSGAYPSSVSKNFYAEISDANGNVLQRKVSPLFESTAAGSFDLPKDLKGRHIHFRAYSAWMLNFDTAFIYEKDIRLANAITDSPSSNLQAERHLQFFPEGGDIISGVDNNIGFKATGPFGLPFAVKGVIKDKSGKQIQEFSSAHDGMGKLLLSPENTDSLYASWKDDAGNDHTTGLPSIKNSGAVLRIIPANKKILFSIARSADENPDNYKFTIIAHMHQHLVYKAKVNLGDNFMSGGSIPTDQLPSGILQVTLFNGNDMPVAERVVFVNNHDFEFTPDVLLAIKSVARRGNNVIEISVPDTLRSNLSLSITDALADGIGAGTDNIISRLLFTGDLKGYVHNPYYYFSNASDSVASYLDLVMLTHGWRRFKWDQVVRGKTPTIKNIDQEHLALKVEVLGVDPSKIAKDEMLSVILKKKDSSTQILQVPHLSAGKFGIGGLIFYDTATAYYQFNINRKLSDEAAVTFNTGLLREYKKVRPLTIPNDLWVAGDSSLLRRNRFIMQETERSKPVFDQKVKTLEAVTVRAKQKSDAQRLDEKYTSGMFSGGDASTFDLASDPFAVSSLDIFTYLQGKVAGLQINNNGATPSLQWRGSTPSLYLNEMQIDATALKNTPVSDIAMIKVFRPGTSVGAGGGAGGSIAVYTKKGNEARNSDAGFKGLERTRVVGYSVSKEFYSPDYTNINTQNEAEDTRSTLLWKPYILTDKDTRKVIIRFYNNDITKVIRVVLEGINEEGKLARVEKIIQ
ncbi:MAG TPA: hypothetical protein VNV85_01655 [Puia sp.]|nr:hypothetical protein [Puia sp.]